MKPYAPYLDDHNPREVIAATSGRLAGLMKRLGPSGLECSLAPGKWPVRAIICHLADSEVAFAFRFRQALAEPHHTIQPFDQDAWAEPYQGPRRSGSMKLRRSEKLRLITPARINLDRGTVVPPGGGQ